MIKASVLLSCVLLSLGSPRAFAQFDEDQTIEDELKAQEDHETTPVPKPDEGATLTPDNTPPSTVAPAKPDSPATPEPPASVEAKRPAPVDSPRAGEINRTEDRTYEPKIEAPVEKRVGAEPEYDGSERATSSGKGEPIFDWSKHKGEREVKHPFYEKGLIRVSKDREYYYRIEESKATRAMAFRVGIFNPINLSNPDEKGDPGSTFRDNYGSSTSPALMLDYEWRLWRTELGKIDVLAGGGLFLAQGHGHFVGGVNAALTPMEVFTFITIPLDVGVVYRLQWHDRQTFVPYGEAGGTLYNFTEMRDDSKPPKFGAALGAYLAAGVAFNMTSFNALNRIAINREYGISAIYLTAEYRQLLAFSRYDFTSSLVNGGFLMEF